MLIFLGLAFGAIAGAVAVPRPGRQTGDDLVDALRPDCWACGEPVAFRHGQHVAHATGLQIPALPAVTTVELVRSVPGRRATGILGPGHLPPAQGYLRN